MIKAPATGVIKLSALQISKNGLSIDTHHKPRWIIWFVVPILWKNILVITLYDKYKICYNINVINLLDDIK